MATSSREYETRAQPWGTLEELLLACAVKRHGTSSWDTVAMELQTRTSSSALLTAQSCRDKFDDLKRRLQSQNDNDNQSSSLATMVDELRRLRVVELRSEVRRRDVLIVSLDLKLKRLEEEREQSLKAEAKAEAGTGSDLRRRGEDRLPENLAGKTNSGEDLYSNRSFNESNSTSQRGEVKENSGYLAKQAEAEEEAGPEGSKPDQICTGIGSEPDLDCSVNGKVMDEDENKNNKKGVGGCGGGEVEEAGRLSVSNSAGESKREGKRGRAAVSKRDSDVQSSAASLSETKRRRGGGGSRSRRSSSGQEGEEGDEVSPATKKGVKQLKLVKHEPLIKVLRIIRAHRLGSVFERRHRSQESERYKSLIRQHMDLHEIQTRLNKGIYTDCTRKFFRDLLLLFNNAVVFFRKTSPEHVAAQELRPIVLTAMNDQLPKPQPVIVNTVKPKVHTIEYDGSEKPIKSSIVVCTGKRGSVNALSAGGAKNKRGDKKEREGEVEEKPKVNEKKRDDDAFVKVEEEEEDRGIRTKRTQERAARQRGQRAQRGSRRTSSSRSVGKTTTTHEYGGNELSSHDGLEMEKKENGRKKQGAARFLKRMKQNSSSTEVREENSDWSEDDTKDSVLEEVEKKKKSRGRKKPDVERKKRATRSSTGSRGRGGGRREQESSSSGRAKRGVGRPPKRPESARAGSGKRGRENGEADEVGSAGRPRKRTRR